MLNRLKAAAEELINSDLSVASTLPAKYYVDPDVSKIESERIFARTWQIVARRDQLAKHGDFITAELAGEQVLVSRGNNGELRGFYNVCGTAPIRPPPDAETARFSAAGITDGLTASMASCSMPPKWKAQKSFPLKSLGCGPFGLGSGRCGYS